MKGKVLFCFVSSIRRLMFPSKMSTSLNIPDLHPKVTYCFSEGSAVSHWHLWLINVCLTFALLLIDPQWHVTVGPGELCQRAGTTFMWAERERDSQAEPWAARHRQEDVWETSWHRLILFESTVGTESIQTPLNCSLFAKIKNCHFISQHPNLTEKNRNVEMIANYCKSFFINLQTFQNFCFFLSRWGAECTLIRNKINFGFRTHCIYFIVSFLSCVACFTVL